MSKKPNVLFVMVDQWNAECFSGLSHPDVKTPNIDRLIEGGACFRNCFAANPICQPSRVSFMTGQYIHTHGVETNHHPSRPKSVNHPLPLLLKEQGGYRTGAFGKLHLGAFEADAGFDRVEHVCDNPFGEPEYYVWLRGKGLLDSYLGVERASPQEVKHKFCYGTSPLKAADTNEVWTADRTISFINESDDPFFAWCTFERPHAPHMPPADAPVKYDPAKLTIPPYDPKYFESKAGHARAGCENLWKAWVLGEDELRRGLAGYYGLMSLIDQQVGRIIAALEKSGKLDDTIIIFTADHGDFAGTQGMLGKNTSTYDAIIRSPYIWYWKNRFDRAMPFDLCETIDLYPTLCEVLGLETPSSVQGASHRAALNDVPYFRGKDYVFSERILSKTVRSRTHKLTIGTDGAKHTGELYDLVADPDECHNLYNRPELARIQVELLEEMVAWYIRTAQPCYYSQASSLSSPALRWHNQFMARKA
ncbi:MAG: sulfatase-like hydrolase/transferase [Lentisphaerae bacterium]|nr:sulfatase-like hydrolase/transferase [Lentisphaerota bacterium]